MSNELGIVVCFVNLALRGDSSLVATAIASGLGIQEAPGHALLETLIASLKNKTVLLLVDNCEHVIFEAATIVDALMHACPNLRILATSREPLRAAGERTYRLPSLDEHAAVLLFADRAKAADAHFMLTDNDRTVVHEICRRLGGIPLAIELAAARVTILSPSALLDKLKTRLDVLILSDRTAPPRHQTMRSTINWSYDLLTAGEQCAFENLAVFCGGCTFEAARDVLGPTTSDDNATLSVLCSLVDKSLLEASTSGIEPRYRLLEPIREFAWERLGAREGQKSALRRHALSCLRVAEDLEAAYDLEPDSVWRELAFCERENWRAALALTLAGEGGCSRWSASGEHVGHGMGVPSAGRRPALVDARSRQDYRGNAGGNSRKHLPRSGPPCS